MPKMRDLKSRRFSPRPLDSSRKIMLIQQMRGWLVAATGRLQLQCGHGHTGVAEYDAIHLDLPLDVLQLDLADARQGLGDFVVYLIEHLLCDSDPTRLGQWLPPRRAGSICAPHAVPAA